MKSYFDCEHSNKTKGNINTTEFWGDFDQLNDLAWPKKMTAYTSLNANKWY